MVERFGDGSAKIAQLPLISNLDNKSDFVEEQVLPLYSEEIAVSRRKVEKAVVRIATVNTLVRRSSMNN